MTVLQTGRLRCLLLALLISSATVAVRAQDSDRDLMNAAAMELPVPPTPDASRTESFERNQQLYQGSLVAAVPAQNIGPTVMSGRVVDIDVSPVDPTHFYVAYASGGLWRTLNNGQSFEPVFDNLASITIGSVAIHFKADGEDDIWVGTGESNSSRSSYAGTGVYRSRDGGKTWESLGLEATQHIGTIVLHPESSEVAWVAALGHLYSPNEERGVYRTGDGGKTWSRVLYVDEHTGAAWIEPEPGNPEILYAGMWERERRAWNFVESGSGSGVYKSVDGGLTWTLLSTPSSGFPTGAGVGRIGLAISAASPQMIYALVDNQNNRPKTDEDEQDSETLTRDQLRSMSRDEFLALDKKHVEEYLQSNGFPRKYDYDTVSDMIRKGTVQPVALVEFVEDANQQLFDTPVIGAELYRSDDEGKTWTRTHTEFIDGLYNSYGYYFGAVSVSPINPNQVYILGVPLLASDDGGATFHSIGGPSVHADHHSLWISPSRAGHLLNGNDGGVNLSYDNGENWSKLNSPSVGQFYAIEVDESKPYNVYGGLQDNGVWYGPSTYSSSASWHGSGDYPYQRIAGGDGMQVAVDTRSNDLVYTGSQFGFYSRVNLTTGERSSIRPQHNLGDRPLRFNWQTPVLVSSHQQDVVYIAANRLYRSLNQGDDLEPISEDLTNGGQPGDVPFGTISTIDESPLRFGLLYTGSDDGLIHVSKDGGVAWNRISEELPQDRWVSRVEASGHEEQRVYATLNGYRSDEFDSWVYVSENYGSTWTRIGLDLPKEPVNVILEDPDDEDLLYVGTDHGLYVSTDRGETFHGLSSELPRVPVHDLKIQNREADLLVGTHGRSIYRIDLEEVRAVAGAVGDTALYAFEIDAPRYRDSWGTRRASWTDYYEPDVTLKVFVAEAGELELQVVGEEGRVIKEWTETARAGMNYFEYDLTADAGRLKGRKKDDPLATWKAADNGETYLHEGKYVLKLSRGNASAERPFELKGESNPRDRSMPSPEEEGEDAELR